MRSNLSMNLLIIFLSLVSLTIEQECETTEKYVNGQCIKKSCFERYCLRLKHSGCIHYEPTILEFEGSVEWTGVQAKVTIKFSDQRSDGTMNRDNQNSCIMNKLYSYNEQTNVDISIQPSITSTYDSITAKRVWNMTLDSKTESHPETTVYMGSYRLKFYLADELQIVYQFQYVLEVNFRTKTLINSIFKNITYQDQVDSTLQFCLESTCSTPINSTQFYLNQNFWLLQKVTAPVQMEFNLSLQSIQLFGESLNKTYTRVSVDSSKQGQLILGLRSDFIYSEITIIVNSIFSQDAKPYLNHIFIQNKINTNFLSIIELRDCFSTLQFCNEPTCSNPTQFLDLDLNQEYWILQKITTPEFIEYSLELQNITFFRGDGLLRQVNPQYTNTSTKGQLTIGLSSLYTSPGYINSILSSMGKRVYCRDENTTNEPDPASNGCRFECIRLNESESGVRCSTSVQLKELNLSNNFAIVIFAMPILLLFV